MPDDLPATAGRAGLGGPLSLFWIFREVIWCRETCLRLVMFKPVDCCLGAPPVPRPDPRAQ